jgi:hypothetical protein
MVHVTKKCNIPRECPTAYLRHMGSILHSQGCSSSTQIKTSIIADRQTEIFKSIYSGCSIAEEFKQRTRHDD